VTPASWPRPDGLAERMLVVDAASRDVRHMHVSDLAALLDAGDVVVVNDAATVPASLLGRLGGERVELRLVSTADGETWRVVLFGDGDFRARTEDRPPPPRAPRGAVVEIDGSGPARLRAIVVAREPQSERLVRVRFEVAGGVTSRAALWSAIYDAGRPVQYSHIKEPLPLWHVQTAFAAEPWAVEMPSAGRPLGTRALVALRSRGVAVASLTHAAGLSATGDDALDAALPLEERYRIPESTVLAVTEARRRGGRVLAIGTSVTRALEGVVAERGELLPGEGITALRIGPGHARRVVDGLLTGVHDGGTSHYELLSSFAPVSLLERAWRSAAGAGYLGHEFGDSALVWGSGIAGAGQRLRLSA
jgi:S-adenosylmethionine:tRNA ribosyltransferase-isomerase